MRSSGSSDFIAAIIHGMFNMAVDVMQSSTFELNKVIAPHNVHTNCNGTDEDKNILE
jgi:hypothetical protein